MLTDRGVTSGLTKWKQVNPTITCLNCEVTQKMAKCRTRFPLMKIKQTAANNLNIAGMSLKIYTIFFGGIYDGTFLKWKFKTQYLCGLRR